MLCSFPLAEISVGGGGKNKVRTRPLEIFVRSLEALQSKNSIVGFLKNFQTAILFRVSEPMEILERAVLGTAFAEIDPAITGNDLGID